LIFFVNKISYIVELSIQGGKLDEFKAKAEGYVPAVKDNEPDTLAYEWYLSPDGKRCLIREAFASSDALLTHLGNVGPSLPELLAIAPITQFEVLGTASEAVVNALSDFGVVHFSQLGGFER